MSININPDTDDCNYRYKMPKIQVRLAGRGNGSYTFLDNIDDVSIEINTPTNILLNFIGRSLGSSINIEKKTITGHYNFDIIKEEIYNYIRFFVLCQKCSIPEILPVVTGSKKKKILNFKCSACGEQFEINSDKKLYQKTLEVITKNVESYEIKKGNLVEVEETKKLFNPF